MPIGKNAIKRVSNNGYSNVQTSAPDMENSTTVNEKVETPKVEKVVTNEVNEKTKKTTEKKSTPQKSMETEPDLSPVNTVKKVTKKTKATSKRDHDFFAIGEELPSYLL